MDPDAVIYDERDSAAPQGQGPAAGKEPWDRPKDPARRFAYWFTSQPYQIQRNFIEHWLGEHPADSLAFHDAVAEGHQEAHELDDQVLEWRDVIRGGIDADPYMNRMDTSNAHDALDALCLRLSTTPESQPTGADE